MHSLPRIFLRAGLVLSLLAAVRVSGQEIIADSFNVANAGTGFGLHSGVNAGINPPTTRLTGITAANLRYFTTTTKPATAFAIAGNKLRVTPAANPGRFTLSADGTTAFDFAGALGSLLATPQQPVVYDLTISMANLSPGPHRCSFALAATEGDATTWDFGIQLYRATATDNFYTIGKRIDVAASGLATDVNTFITNTPVGTAGSEVNLVMRITDAGSETATFNSRVQLSLDGGFTWFYDTATDPDLPTGWRLNGAGRFIIWDVAPDAGNVTYDNFSVRPVPMSAVLVTPPDQSANASAAPLLQVAVSNSAPGDLTVVFYGRQAPRPFPGPDFCIGVMPDTQNYARENSGHGEAIKEMWFAQTEWLVTNRVAHNIAYLAHLGDCVQNGDIKNGSPNTTEWRNATNAMYRLENPARTLLRDGLPYGIAVGNHDQEPMGEPDGDSTLYNQYFGVAHFAGRAYYGGHFSNNNDNHFDLFSVSGLDFLVLYFEFGRHGSSVMNWANAVIATNQHRRIIAVTHWAGSDSTPCNLSNHGEAIFDGLKDNPNFFLLLGGHVFDNGGEGSRTDNYQGRPIRTLISNYQGRMNGGNGWMRLMYFSPSNNTVTVRTYSPWLDQYETDANSQMTFSYNLQLAGGPGAPGTPYLPLATNAAVAPGTVTSHVWSGLQANENYDWFVQVTDVHGNRRISPAWRFATVPNSAPIASNQFIVVTGDAPQAVTLTASDSNGDALTYQVVSQPLDGQLSDFNPQTGKATYLPSRGYQGPDRIMFRAMDGFTNSNIATINFTVVAPTDSNGNGLPDHWETTYGVTDPNADSDGDGQTDFAEYKANSNPTNAASVFRILAAGWQTNHQFGLAWSSVGGTRYRIQYADSEFNESFPPTFLDIFRTIQEEMDSAPHGQSSTQFFADPLATPHQSRYYRIKVLP